MRRLKRIALLILGAFGISIAVFSGYLFVAQEGMIYHPRSYGAGYQLASGGVAELPYRTSQGNQISFYLPPRLPANPRQVWMLFAGNGSLALDWKDFLARVDEPNDCFLLVEYPGYGRCEGQSSPETILESSRAAFEALAAKLQRDPRELGAKLNLLGHSLGAAAALQFSTQFPVRRVVLAAPFTSMRAMAERVVGFPFCYLLKHNFDNLSQLELLAQRPAPPRVAIFHGLADSLIPPSMGRALAEAHPKFVSFNPIEDGQHESILYDALPQIAEIIRLEPD